MKALFQEYSKRDDLDAVAAVDRDLQEVLALCSQREADARAILRELTRQVQDLEAASAYPHREGMHAERVAALQAEVGSARRMVEQLSSDSRLCEQQRDELEQRLQQAASAHSEVMALQDAEEPQLRHQLSLYAHISKVTWRLDHEDTVAGTVSDPKSGDIRLFNFDTSSTPKFELVNALWELL